MVRIVRMVCLLACTTVVGGLREKVGSPGWARTSDNLINSQALYRLSYRGVAVTPRATELELDWSISNAGGAGRRGLDAAPVVGAARL